MFHKNAFKIPRLYFQCFALLLYHCTVGLPCFLLAVDPLKTMQRNTEINVILIVPVGQALVQSCPHLNVELNKHCSKISQGTLLHSFSNVVFPLYGRTNSSFTLLSVKDVMLLIFQHCQQAIQMLCTLHRQAAH
jgi:hypothetical protein